MNVLNKVVRTAEVISSPEMAEWGVHRRAGLAGQLLIATTAQA